MALNFYFVVLIQSDYCNKLRALVTSIMIPADTKKMTGHNSHISIKSVSLSHRLWMISCTYLIKVFLYSLENFKFKSSFQILAIF